MQYKSGFLSFQEKINRKDKSGMRQGEWRTIYPDGKIQTEVTYRDDKKNGYYREYYPNGSSKLVILYKDDAIVTNNTESTAKFDSKVTYDKPTRTWNKGTYLDGRPIGLHVEYTDTSKKYSSKLYDNGVFSGEGMSDSLGLLQGFWKEFYPTGELRGEGNYTDSKRTGVWKFYFPSAKLEQTGSYKNGKPNGQWKWFYEDGTLRREEGYINGLEDGFSTEYSDTNTVIAKGDYVMGYKQGVWLEYSGGVKMEGEYNDGEQNSVWKHYYPTAELAFEGKYANGQPEGKHTWYFKNGKVKEEGSYISGKRNGLWRKYNTDGTVYMYTDYEYGIEVKFDGVKVKPETLPGDIVD
jgi:antitoxin component YwqK of YwqJK toxin-antitoxin module